MRTIVTIVFAGCACSAWALAQSNSVASSDRTFIDKAAQGGMAEVELGQLAQQKASSQAVKDFGKRMEKDHSMANDKLKTIASAKGVTIPSSLNAKDKALYDRLSGMSGSAFDKAYMRAMIKDHNEDISEFKKESDKGKDQDVKSFASMTLPTLQDHLQMAKQVGSEVGVASASETRSSETAQK